MLSATSVAAPDTETGSLVTKQVAEEHEFQQTIISPERGNWTTESFSTASQNQLKLITKQLKHPQEIDTRKIESAVSEKIACDQLRPTELEQIYQGEGMTVMRLVETPANANKQTFQGLDAFIGALEALGAPFSDAEAKDIHVKIKTIRVFLDGDRATTTNFVEVTSTNPQGAVQQIATWNCQWKTDAKELPKLIELRLLEFEEAIYQSAESTSSTWFTDCTRAVLGANSSFGEQLVYGMNHWIGHLEEISGINNWVKCGLAVGDVNGDGLDDIYICQPGGLPNRLFVQNLDGTATDVSHAAGVDWLDYTSSALLIDLDNDGDQDLVVGVPTNLLLLENDGTGKFTLNGHLSLIDQDVQSLSSVDYDNDGDLDIFVCIYNANVLAENRVARKFVFYDAENGGANVMLRNETANGQPWKFTNVTQEVGLDQHGRRLGMSASWEDYDLDGDQDLYIANDFGQNSLYRNENGLFTDVAKEAGVVDFGFGMSSCWGDVNRDGHPDLYVGNMFSSAGNRVTTQDRFLVEKDDDIRKIYKRFVNGNSLYLSQGDGTFREVAEEARAEIARWAWSSILVDLNNDGWDDAFVANGYITTEDTGDL